MIHRIPTAATVPKGIDFCRVGKLEMFRPMWGWSNQPDGRACFLRQNFFGDLKKDRLDRPVEMILVSLWDYLDTYIYIICVCMYMRYYGFIMVYQCLSATLDIMQRKRLYRISGIFFQPSTVNFYLVQLVISGLCVLPQGSSYGNVSPSSSTEKNPISPKNTIPALTNGGETHDDVKETTNDPGLAISCAACMA